MSLERTSSDALFQRDDDDEFGDLDLSLAVDGIPCLDLEQTFSEDNGVDDNNKTGSSKKRKYINRQKLELDYLRKKVEEMQKQLEFLESMQRNQVQNGSQWKDEAKEQQRHAHEAMLENVRLKTAIQEELTFAESLAGIVQKRPKVLTLLTTKDDHWKEYKIACSDANGRRAAFSEIADREYHKVLRSLLFHGHHHDDQFTVKNTVKKSTTVKYFDDDGESPGIAIESFNRLQFQHVHFRMLGFAIWRFMNGDANRVVAPKNDENPHAKNAVDMFQVYGVVIIYFK
jgi:hypothetical protein